MKVWIVYSTEGGGILGVYSKKSKAEKAQKKAIWHEEMSGSMMPRVYLVKKEVIE